MTTNKLIIELERYGNLSVLFAATIFLILIGATSNFVVMNQNNYKMPVKIAYDEIVIFDEHFTYAYDSQVNLPLLTDRIYLNEQIYSIGDIIMYVACLLMFINLIFLIKCVYKIRKLKHDRKKIN